MQKMPLKRWMINILKGKGLSCKLLERKEEERKEEEEEEEIEEKEEEAVVLAAEEVLSLMTDASTVESSGIGQTNAERKKATEEERREATQGPTLGLDHIPDLGLIQDLDQELLLEGSQEDLHLIQSLHKKIDPTQSPDPDPEERK
eukprot:TRINITY_DN348_c0_g1_i2.p2 TRINITY_DN348_c0_g1~~TRINITY_DN348_c0_g1_i2.p2  ORF type:complete len:146 (-),score=47.14 TRINITY_DN348_c0_g1_i2:82-519(-)